MMHRDLGRDISRACVIVRPWKERGLLDAHFKTLPTSYLKGSVVPLIHCQNAISSLKRLLAASTLSLLNTIYTVSRRDG